MEIHKLLTPYNYTNGSLDRIRYLGHPLCRRNRRG